MADLSDDIRSLVQSGIEPVSFEEISNRGRRPRRPRGRTVARIASVAVVLAVAVPVIRALGSAPRSTTPKHVSAAQHRVIAALSTTVDSGSFDISYSQTPLTSPTSPTTTTTACSVSHLWTPVTIPNGSSTLQSSTPTTVGNGTNGGTYATPCEPEGASSPGLSIVGHGTIDTNPFAMVAVTQVPGFGQITLRDDGVHIWEIGGGNYGLAPDSTDSGPGSSLSGFAGLVEGTLGASQGASDMMVLANPTGYLELDENAITSADQVGTDTVDGVPVTVYQVTLNPDQEASVTGTNPEEATAIRQALAVLRQQGYTGTTVKISIDAGGYIRQTVSTAKYSDGSTQTSQTIFSNFGCAGTVLMPGQTGASSPPANCTSPDTASASS